LLPAVLLVDDHPPNLVALQAVLDPLRLRLVRATSGPEALEHLEREDFAAVVLDVRMPGIDGFETASQLRRRRRNREVPIIFVTAGGGDDGTAAKAYAHGAVDFLSKPYDPDALRAKVLALVEQWRRGDILRAQQAQQHDKERAALQSAIRKGEADLRLIIDGVRDHAISMLDPAGNIKTFNAPAERIKGYALSEVQGRNFEIFFTEEDRARGLPQAEIETARMHGRYEGEGWRRRKDGSLFYAAVSLSALRDEAGGLLGFVKVTQDITERRQLSEALRRREAEMRLIIDAIPGLVAYIRPDQTYRFVNRAYERWFGIPERDVVDHHVSQVLGEGAYRVLAPRLATALSGERVRFEDEIPYREGDRRWVRADYVPDIGSDGQVQGLVSLVLDTTEAKRAEQQLVEEARVNETLNRIGAALAGNLDLDSIFQRLTDEATRLCRAQFGAFFYNVTAPEGCSYMLYTLSGVPRERFAGFPMPRNTAVFAPTFAGEGPVRSDDITRDPRYGHSSPHHGMPAGHLPVRSYLAVPVLSRSGEVHGGLFFGHADVGMFTERDERMLVAVAAQAAVAVDNAHLHAATTAAEEKYRALAESSPQLVWTANARGDLEYCNQRFADFVGVGQEELLRGDAWARVTHPDDIPQAASAWSHAIATGEPYEVEYRFRRAADGGYRWFLARGVPVRDAAGQITRWVGSSTDIDEHKRVEETQRFLADAGTLLGSSLDDRAALIGLARLAVPRMADWCSVDLRDDQGAVERIALAHADPRKLQAATALRERYPATDEEAVRRILATGKSERVRELTGEMLEVSARDPEQLALMRELGLRSWMAAPISVHGQTLGVITFASAESGRLFEERDQAVAEDLGRRAGVAIDGARLFESARRERTRAEEANRAKDLFLGSLSHELRTPLNAILGWTRMLRGGGLPEDKQRRALETIERNARAQVALIEEILDLSRITSGKMRLTVAPVEIAQIIETSLDTIRPAAQGKGIQVQAVLDPDAGLVHGDATRLQQICWNLLSNAVKFTPRGGRVYVRLTRTSSQVELVVADTGRGIDPSFLPLVFERFTQADATSTREHGGLGLGLAIVKHLVELHGGTVRAESPGRDRGATFVVRLPVAPVRALSTGPAEAPSALAGRSLAPDFDCPPELAGLEVLVVDDEPDARELVQSLLESCHARVTTAPTARAALQRFKDHPPQVLVSDIGMPGEDGLWLIRQVRALPPEDGGNVPAVAVTAYAALGDRTRVLTEGFTVHLSKPTEPQELLAAVAAVVGIHRPREDGG
jgi:PAS domain S-box-containing protein